MNLWSIRGNEPQRVYSSNEEAGIAELACCIIEQAVIDWQTLDYGNLNRTMGKSDTVMIYTDEVLEFFQSKWFEHLLSFALPHHSPQQIRKALRIPEPRRKKKNARASDRARN